MVAPKGQTPWNKGRKIAKPRKCGFCPSYSKVYFNTKLNALICSRHHWHFLKYARILTDEEARERLKTSQSKWIGKRAWNYKGGRATLNMLVRRCARYKKWVRSVFIRDDFTCQKCGVKGAYLEADHYPVRYSTIFDEERITTYDGAMACERLWDIKNGRTLCRKCHRGNGINNGKSKKSDN